MILDVEKVRTVFGYNVTRAEFITTDVAGWAHLLVSFPSGKQERVRIDADTLPRLWISAS